jgi:Ca-activated chloride channel family protein
MKSEPAAVLAAASGRAVSLKGVDAAGRVAGMLLSMTVRQTYRNDTSDTLEIVYSFPLAWGAVLLGLSASIAGRRLDGTVLARPDAEARYEEAVASGDTPIMVRKVDGSTYSADLGNLKPGEEAVIELRYAQLLRIEQGRLRLTVPTTIAPRYGDPAAMRGLREHDSLEASPAATYGFSLAIELDGQAAAGGIASPSHPVRVEPHEDGARVTLDGPAWLDRDFVLTIDGFASPGGTVRALRAPDGEGCVGVASVCPVIDAPRREALAVKVLVDCSGSMSGDSIDAARRGLERVLSVLRPADAVSFGRFGNAVEQVFDRLHPANPATLAALRRAVADTDATMGGTELERALRSTFALPGADGADVLLVTDGQVTDVERIVAAAVASGHRIFAVGVGTAPRETLLRRLAEETGGACELVAPNESIEDAIERTFARLHVPRVRDLEIDWGATPAWTTRVPGSLFDGDTVHLFAGFDPSAPPRRLRVGWSVGKDGGTGRHVMEATLADVSAVAVAVAGDAESSPAAVLPRIAAWQRISEAGEGHVEESEGFVRDLALRHRLVTDETNLFLVHVRADEDKATDLPTLEQTKQMLAAGWGGTGSVRFMRSRPVDVAYSMRAPADMDALPTISRSARGGSNVPWHQASEPVVRKFSGRLTDGLRRFLEGMPSRDEGEPTVARETRKRPLRGTTRMEPARLLAIAGRHLGDGSGLDALVARLSEVNLPAPLADALRALVGLGLSERDAWALLLHWLAHRIGDGRAPGEAAMHALDARAVLLPAQLRHDGERALEARLGAATTAGW